MVQFHPSYAYEDFVEGLHLVERGDHVIFGPVPGKLLNVAEHARSGKPSSCTGDRRNQQGEHPERVRRTPLPARVSEREDRTPPPPRVFTSAEPLHHRDDEHGRPQHPHGGHRPKAPVRHLRVPPKLRHRRRVLQCRAPNRHRRPERRTSEAERPPRETARSASRHWPHFLNGADFRLRRSTTCLGSTDPSSYRGVFL